MAEGISLREFGRMVDVSGEYIRRAIAEGKIPKDCIGSKPVGNSGKSWPVITNPAKAREAWLAARDPLQVRDKEALADGAKRGWAQRRGEEPPPERDDDVPMPMPAPSQGGKGGASGLPSIADSQQRKAYAQAQLAVLELQERSGRLVNADQMKVGFINLVTSAKTRLMGVPSKAKVRIPTLSVRDIEQLEDLIAEALEELALDGR